MPKWPSDTLQSWSQPVEGEFGPCVLATAFLRTEAAPSTAERGPRGSQAAFRLLAVWLRRKPHCTLPWVKDTDTSVTFVGFQFIMLSFSSRSETQCSILFKQERQNLENPLHLPVTRAAPIVIPLFF